MPWQQKYLEACHRSKPCVNLYQDQTAYAVAKCVKQTGEKHLNGRIPGLKIVRNVIGETRLCPNNGVQCQPALRWAIQPYAPWWGGADSASLSPLVIERRKKQFESSQQGRSFEYMFC